MPEEFSFTVLGSGTTVPDPERGPAGFLLSVCGSHYLVDGGSGTLQRCAKAGVDPRQLRGGFYSHRHPDHTGDLVPLLFSMKVGPPQRRSPYPIYAGEGFLPFFEALHSVYGRWIEGECWRVVVNELPLDRSFSFELDSLTIRTAPANHSAGALHLRFEHAGSSVVFSGDTGPSRELERLAADCDLLVCECGSTNESTYSGHMSPQDVVELVRASRPREVWLTHFYPDVDADEEMRLIAGMGIPIRRAKDGDTWAVRS